MLGVVKSVMQKIGSWLRSNNKNALFVAMAKGVLGHVKSMNIEWCKILEYPNTEKTGGWVSETFLAMARLGNWFYVLITRLPDSVSYTDPETHHSTWVKAQSEKWLQMRGLTKNGKASDLKKVIGDYIENQNVPPLLMRYDIIQDDIMQLVKSTCLLLSTVMSRKTNTSDITRLEAIIRFFLISYHKVDKGNETKEAPSWITRYNLLCLLNLPETMKKFGTMRNLWEGGIDGEAYLKKVKYQLKAGLVNEWQTWSLNNLLHNDIYADWKQETDTDEFECNQNIRKECKIYGNYRKAKQAFHSGKVFSGIQIAAKYYLCYRHEGKIAVKRIVILEQIESINNMNYYTLSLRSTKVEISNNDDSDYIGVLFLPKLTKEGYPKVRKMETEYCLIKSDWS
jgi:hypothetical protein